MSSEKDIPHSVEKISPSRKRVTITKHELRKLIELYIDDDEVIGAARGNMEGGIEIDLINRKKLKENHLEQLRERGLDV